MTNKPIAALLIAAAILSSCSKEKAASPEMQLYNRADSAYTAGNPDLALSLLDSLDRSRPQEADVLRLSMALRPRAIEAQTTALISRADSTIDANRQILERLKPGLKHIALPNIDGYYTDAKQYNEHFLNTTGISARVTEIGEFYIVSSLNPAGGLKHNSITLMIGNEGATTPDVPYDGNINYRIAGSEMITFSPAQSDSVGRLASLYPDKPATLRFNGEKGGGKSVKLSAAQVAAIASTYDYARALNAMRDATVQREKLNAILDLARAKIAANEAKEQK